MFEAREVLDAHALDGDAHALDGGEAPLDEPEREFTLDGETGRGRARERTRDEGLAAIEALRRDLVLRTADAAQRTHRFVSSGALEIDSLTGGGFPRGRLSEVTGPPSSGRTALLLAAAAAVTRRGEVVAWIDPSSALDVRAAASAGVSLPYFLWVRPKTAASAWSAADIVLGTGGFTLVVVDVGDPPRGASRWSNAGASSAPHTGERKVMPAAVPDAPMLRCSRVRFDSFASRAKAPKAPALSQVWTRLSRGAERSGAAVVLLADRHLAGTFAALTLDLAPAERAWRGPTPEHAVLVGTLARCRVARNKLGPPDRTALVGFGETPERRSETVSLERQSFAAELARLQERSTLRPAAPSARVVVPLPAFASAHPRQQAADSAARLLSLGQERTAAPGRRYRDEP